MNNHQWLLLSNGKDMTIPKLSTVPDIGTIAWALSHINRFTGHANRAYSVAEHSILVADIATARGAADDCILAALMHDAHECVTGDMASPIKQIIGSAWDEFESNVEDQFRTHYGLNDSFRKYRDLIKEADLIALATERRDLMHWSIKRNLPWPIIDGEISIHFPSKLVDLNSPYRRNTTPSEWSAKFRNIFERLSEKVDAT